jgi:hypothetical protein
MDIPANTGAVPHLAAASDGTVNDFGAVHSVFFRDPDGLEGEVLIPKADHTIDS